MPRVHRPPAILLLFCALLATACRPAQDAARPDASAGAGPSIVVVVLDAARADHFGSYGYARSTTPRADAFAGSATRYATVLAEASYTFLSTSALFTGQSPAESGLGARNGGRVPARFRLLAEEARAAGYSTWGYSENPYVTDYFGLTQGFDVFIEALPTSEIDVAHSFDPPTDAGERLSALTREIARADDRPFLLYVHLLRPHNPYRPPAPFRGRFGSGEGPAIGGETPAILALDRAGPPYPEASLETLVDLYDENLAYADFLFGELLDALERHDLDRNAIVVLTSDHGEAFGEHGRLLHSTQLYDEMLRVPLLVRVPGGAAGVVNRPVQLADLGQGLRSVVRGGSSSALTRLSRGTDPGEPLFSFTNAATGKLAAWTPEHRLLLDMRSQEAVAYYDLAADPANEHPIPLDAEGRRLLAAAREATRAWTGGPAAVSTDRASGVSSAFRSSESARATEADARNGGSDALGARRRAELEALGYLDP